MSDVIDLDAQEPCLGNLARAWYLLAIKTVL
jgi:hypothetical protein